VVHTWRFAHQDDFHTDFCKLLIANGCAWLVVNNPQTHLFLDKWIPNAPKPDCKHLSGPVLDAEVKRVEDVVRSAIVGKIGTGECDGWKSRSKKAVVSSMVIVIEV